MDYREWQSVDPSVRIDTERLRACNAEEGKAGCTDNEPLTPREFDLLEFFLQHPRQVLTRELISTRVWGYDYNGGSNAIDVCIKGLREKLEAGARPRLDPNRARRRLRAARGSVGERQRWRDGPAVAACPADRRLWPCRRGHPAALRRAALRHSLRCPAQSTDQKLAWRTQQVRATLWPSSGDSLTPADLPGTSSIFPRSKRSTHPGFTYACSTHRACSSGSLIISRTAPCRPTRRASAVRLQGARLPRTSGPVAVGSYGCAVRRS